MDGCLNDYITFIVFNFVFLATQALVWTADGDSKHQATNGIMYLAKGDPVDYVPKGTFNYDYVTGVRFSHIACDFSNSTMYFSRSSVRGKREL